MADLNLAIQVSAEDRASGPLGAVHHALSGLGTAAKTPMDAIGGLVHGLGAVGLAASGLGALGDAFSGLVSDAAEAQRVQAATNAVLASTKGAAGLSADAIGDLATQLSKVTPFEDETVQSAENMLLTFTNIGKNVFPDATEAALNMSTALGEDSKDAAIQLGKALQDPITGATALRRVGVALTDQQQEQIKAMMAAGNVAGAQGVILKELQTEFGGAARAAGQTFGGQMKILETQIGNLKEAAFTPLLGVIGNVATGLTDLASNDDVIGFVSNLADLVGKGLTWVFDLWGKELTAVQALIAAFTTDTGAMGIVLEQVRKIFGDTVADAIEPFVQAFMGAIPEIQRFAALVMELIQGVGNIISDVLSGDVGVAFDDFRELVAGAGTDLVVQLREWAQAFLSWIGPMIPPLLAQLFDLLRSMETWILGTALPAIVETLATWAAAFVEWVAPLIDPLLHTLGELATTMLSWMVDTVLPLILSNLLKWGVAFVEWVAPLIPPLLIELGKLLLELGQWALDTALPAIIDHLAKWGAEFVAWVEPQIPPLLEQLGALLEQIGAWLLDPALPTIALKLGGWAGAFVAWVADVVPQIPGALGEILTAIAGWVTGGGLAGVQDQATTVGQGFIQGIIDGVGNFLPNLLKTVGDAATKAIGAFTSGFATGLAGGSGQRGPGGELSDAQFGQAVRAMGFTEDEIASICGPIAAEGVARALGMAVNLPNIVHKAEAARFGNFSGNVGTFGNPGEQGILSQLGISSQLVGQQQAQQLAAAGTPVIINTPKHFFLAQGFDPSTGQFDTGATGQVFRGGGRNLSLSQISGLGGGLYGFIAPTAQKGGDTGQQAGLRDQMRAYIRNAAAKNGIDPDIADRVFSGESVGYTQFVGDKGSSFGPAQLHLGGLAGGGNAVAGLGNTFMQQTGLDPRDLTTWPQQIDFSLQQAAEHGWRAWHAAAAQGITDWQGIGVVAKDFVPTLDQTDQSFLDLAATADDSGQTVSDALTGTVSDAQSFAQQFGISLDAANTIIQDHGQIARTVLGESIPGSFVLTDMAVERFADTMGVSWDEARAILSEGGRVSELVMGTAIPDAAGQAATAMDTVTTSVQNLGAENPVWGLIRSNASATGRDLHTYLADIGALGVDTATASLQQLVAMSGLSLPQVQEQAGAAGRDLRAWLLTVGVPAADALRDSLKGTGEKAAALESPISTVKNATKALAKEGFDVSAGSATQVSFVLQQLNDKMPSLIQHIKDFAGALAAIPRDISVNIQTNGALDAAALAGGGDGGAPSAGSGGGGGFDLSSPEGRQAARDTLGPGFVVSDTGILDQSSGQVIQGLQHGGPAYAGRTYLVGEAGPELFVPSSSGHVVPGGVGGIDYRRLAQELAAALANVSITMDGQRVAAIVRGQNTRFYQMSPAGGVGGV